MILGTDHLPVSIEAVSAYHLFLEKHGWSMEALHALVLNDVRGERCVTKASTDYGFDRIMKEEFVRVINDAIIDRNSLRSIVDTRVEFTPEQMNTHELVFQQILVDQIYAYLKVAEQDLADKGVRYSVSRGVGLNIIP